MEANKFSQVIEKNCFDYLRFDKNLKDKFNIIFLDPPYKENKINYLIDKIKDDKLLRDDGIIILHRHKRDSLKITDKLNILDSRNYGISKIVIGN